MALSSNMRSNVGDIEDVLFSKRGCCFRTTTSQRRLVLWEKKVPWWRKGWNKIREWSEAVARPRWKTFIRGFHKNRSIRYKKQGSFHYDVISYAQNFDDGTREKRDEDYVYDFSSRYASLPTSAKSSMDLGNDGPSFM